MAFLLYIKLTPNAGENKLLREVFKTETQTYTKAKVTAQPEKGKANKALIKLLSKELGISPSLIELIQGQTESYKTLKISANLTNFKGILDDSSCRSLT